jgi:F-type H+-transporting ATPase subunit b
VKRLALIFLFAALGTWAQEHGAPEHKAATHETHGEDHGDPFLTWKIINFAILAAGLGYQALRSGGPFFRSRGDEIRQAITEAGKVRAEAEARAAAIEQRIANLGADLEQLREESRQEMAREETRIQADTARQAAKLEENATQEMAQLTKRAEQELKAYAAKLAVDLAEQKVKGRITPMVQTNLIRRFVDDLGKRVN